MNQSLILKASAIVAAIFGIALALAPQELAVLYKAETMNPTGVYNTMLYGGLLIGVAVLNWAASQAPHAEDARYAVLGNLVAMVLSLVIALWWQFTSAAAMPTGWLNVAIFGVFTALFGYLYFAKMAHSTTAGPAHS